MPPSRLGDHSYFAYLEVREIDAYYDRSRDAGVEMIKLLRNEPWGMREFGIRTGDGHRIMFGERRDADPELLPRLAQAPI